MKFGCTRYLDNLESLLDFATRAANVHKSYEAEGDWERELFIESSSFVLSTAAGIGAVKAGLALLFVATPVGWVGLIVTGAAIVGTAVIASTEVNSAVKDNSGAWYDSIMVWISGK